MVGAVLGDFGGDRHPREQRRHRLAVATAWPTPIPARSSTCSGRTRSVRTTSAGWCCRRCATQPRGDIVFISSVATDGYAAGGAPYTWARRPWRRWRWTLAKEEQRHGIHVNIVAPGLVETEMGRRLVKAGGVEDISTLTRPCRSDACASPRTSPTWCGSSSPTRGPTSAASASRSTAAALR